MSLSGKTVAFSGELMGMTRQQATLAAKAAGAFVASSVSGKVDYLVTAPDQGNSVKIAKAQSLGVKILDQPSFSAATSGAAFTMPKVAAVRKVAVPKMAAVSMMPASVQLSGKTIAITGTLQNATRAEAAAMAHAAGASVTNKISASTDYLVCGADATPAKVQAAQMNGIKMISEADFFSASGPKVAVPKRAVTPKAMAVMPTAGSVQLSGKTVAITGTLQNATRAEAAAMAHAAGASVANKISASTDYLVCGADATPAKVQAAQANGIKMISEADFFSASGPKVAVAQKVVVPKMQMSTPQATFGAVSIAGKTVAITGTLENFNRAQAAAHAQQAGATVSQTVNSNTDFLVCGGDATPAKIQAAQSNGVKTLTEAQFAAATGAVAAAPRAVAPRKVAAAAAVPTMAGQVSLRGATIAFTGALKVNRMAAAVMASNAGAQVSNALSAKTTYLVAGSSAGPKLSQAQAMGVQVISEAQFQAACM